MTQAHITDIERDGEHREFAGHGHAELATAGGLTLLRGVFEPGWRWSSDIKPMAGTDTCQVHHRGYMVSGEMQIRMDDGTELTMRAGEMFDLPPGHDAWVVGDQRCEMLDYSADATRYASSMTTIEDANTATVRRGFAAFSAGDMATLREVLSHDVVQHVPGHSQISGAHKGIDAVLAYYGQLAQLTEGTFRVDLIDVYSDGDAHVVAVTQNSATRNGSTRVSRGSLLFTFLGGRVIDLLELHSDVAGDDVFWA